MNEVQVVIVYLMGAQYKFSSFAGSSVEALTTKMTSAALVQVSQPEHEVQ